MDIFIKGGSVLKYIDLIVNCPLFQMVKLPHRISLTKMVRMPLVQNTTIISTMGPMFLYDCDLRYNRKTSYMSYGPSESNTHNTHTLQATIQQYPNTMHMITVLNQNS